MNQPTKFIIYATFQDGRGMVLASKMKFSSRDTAEKRAAQIRKGSKERDPAIRAYVVPVRPGEVAYTN